MALLWFFNGPLPILEGAGVSPRQTHVSMQNYKYVRVIIFQYRTTSVVFLIKRPSGRDLGAFFGFRGENEFKIRALGS